MSPLRRPEAIDSRTVFRAYASAALAAGIVLFMWPTLAGVTRDPETWFAKTRIAAAIIAAFGCCAGGFASINQPIDRRRGLFAFACAHLMFGAMLATQWVAVLSLTMPAVAGWFPLIVGVVLLYLAITGPGADLTPLPPMHPAVARPHATMFAVRNKPSLDRLRSEYEQQIREAARQEERARLARELHDAVKQQLFVIQTAGATAQARFDADAEGARAALEQVRTAAREAMSEMEAMLDQLQGAPIENTGLVAFIRKQCEALGFRTGAHVTFEAGTLPGEALVDPGARQAIARVAQEALSNVARHARAKNVAVSLGTSDERLVLTIEDDGRGFVPDGKAKGMGIEGMAVRAAETGGSLDVASAAEAGTTVRFSVPILQASSPGPYLKRAMVWTGVFLLSMLVMARALSTPVWAMATAAIAGIAAARYVVASFRLMRLRHHA